MKQLLHLNRPSYKTFSFVKLPSSVSHFSFRSRQAICSEGTESITHIQGPSLLLYWQMHPASTPPPSSGPDRNLDQMLRQLKPEGNVASAGRSRWRALVAMSHLVVEHRLQCRSVWSVSRHVTASDSSVCVLQFYWHAIVLSIGQMKCSLCHKSLKPNCCIFDKAVFFWQLNFFVLVTAQRQRMRLTTIFMSEILISKPVHLKVAEQFTSIKKMFFLSGTWDALCFLRVQCLWNDTKSS